MTCVIYRALLKENNYTTLVDLIENAVIGDLFDRMEDYAILYCSGYHF